MITRAGSVLIVALLVAGCGSVPSQPPASPPGSSATRPSASADIGSTPTDFGDLDSGPLSAGTYTLAYSSIAGPQRFPTLAFEFTLAGGWEKVGIEGLLWEDNTKLAFAVPDAVYRDPCNFSLGIVEPPAGSSIADLTEGLLELPSWEVETVEWDAYHGFLGNHVQLTAPADLSGCDQPVAIMRTPGWPGIIEVPFEGALLDFWILNVRGTSLVIYTVTEPDAPEQERAALSAVLESIRITP